MPKNLSLTLSLLIGILASSCSSSTSAEYETCVQKGISYFKEIEAWPNLSDGRNAATVAEERCRRTPTAFG